MDIAEGVKALSIKNKRRRTPIFIHGSSERQCELAFPKHVIDYIIKNPKSPKQWKKLIQTCKLFFDRNPIVVIPCLHFKYLVEFAGENRLQCTGIKWKTCTSDVCDYQCEKSVKFYRRPLKLWITKNLDVFASRINTKALSKTLLPQLFKCDATKIRLSNNLLSRDDLSLLTSNVVDAWISNVYVAEDTTLVVEEIMGSLPASLETITFSLTNYNFTPVTFEKLAKMEHLRKLKKMSLYGLREKPFNFNALFKFVLENKQIWFDIHIHGPIAEEEMTTIQAAAERIQNEEYGIHQRPNICYDNVPLI